MNMKTVSLCKKRQGCTIRWKKNEDPFARHPTLSHPGTRGTAIRFLIARCSELARAPPLGRPQQLQGPKAGCSQRLPGKRDRGGGGDYEELMMD